MGKRVDPGACRRGGFVLRGLKPRRSLVGHSGENQSDLQRTDGLNEAY